LSDVRRSEVLGMREGPSVSEIRDDGGCAKGFEVRSLWLDPWLDPWLQDG
jgi:hypothetical protein